MNFYPHFLGDYARDTQDLSLTEHGAYRALLDYCYATEKALPGGLPELCRIAKAMTSSERKAVSKVAEAFFPVGQDGLRHNARCDLEIAKAHAYADAQSKRAQMRWHKQGQMPERSPDDANHNHNHSKSKSRTKGGQAPPPSPAVPKAKVNGAYNAEAEVVLTYLNRATGRQFPFRNPEGDLTPNAEVIVARLKEGYTGEQLREVVLLKAEKWRGDEKMAEYLRPGTLFGKSKFAQYIAELVAS